MIEWGNGTTCPQCYMDKNPGSKLCGRPASEACSTHLAQAYKKFKTFQFALTKNNHALHKEDQAMFDDIEQECRKRNLI